MKILIVIDRILNIKVTILLILFTFININNSYGRTGVFLNTHNADINGAVNSNIPIRIMLILGELKDKEADIYIWTEEAINNKSVINFLDSDMKWKVSNALFFKPVVVKSSKQYAWYSTLYQFPAGIIPKKIMFNVCFTAHSLFPLGITPQKIKVNGFCGVKNINIK